MISRLCARMSRWCNLAFRLQRLPHTGNAAHSLVTVAPFSHSRRSLLTLASRKPPLLQTASNARSGRSMSETTELNLDLEAVLEETVLKLELIDTDLYRGTHLWNPVGSRSVFGGQIIGQAMVAAANTKPADVSVHSAHCYFVRPGDAKRPIIYRVERTYDGTSFSSRIVKAMQRGEVILSIQISYQKSEEIDMHYQQHMPKVTLPDDLLSIEDIMRNILDKEQLSDRSRSYIEKRLADEVPIDLRPLDPLAYFRIAGYSDTDHEPKQMYWIKAKGYIGDDMELHRCVAAYLSDLTLIPTALSGFPHFKTTMACSLDHAMWFHAPFHADQFMLYECECQRSVNGRSLIYGKLWKQDGTLAVSVCQEGLIRGGVPEPSSSKL